MAAIDNAQKELKRLGVEPEIIDRIMEMEDADKVSSIVKLVAKRRQELSNRQVNRLETMAREVDNDGDQYDELIDTFSEIRQTRKMKQFERVKKAGSVTGGASQGALNKVGSLAQMAAGDDTLLGMGVQGAFGALNMVGSGIGKGASGLTNFLQKKLMDKENRQADRKRAQLGRDPVTGRRMRPRNTPANQESQNQIVEHTAEEVEAIKDIRERLRQLSESSAIGGEDGELQVRHLSSIEKGINRIVDLNEGNAYNDQRKEREDEKAEERRHDEMLKVIKKNDDEDDGGGSSIAGMLGSMLLVKTIIGALLTSVGGIGKIITMILRSLGVFALFKGLKDMLPKSFKDLIPKSLRDWWNGVSNSEEPSKRSRSPQDLEGKNRGTADTPERDRERSRGRSRSAERARARTGSTNTNSGPMSKVRKMFGFGARESEKGSTSAIRKGVRRGVRGLLGLGRTIPFLGNALLVYDGIRLMDHFKDVLDEKRATFKDAVNKLEGIDYNKFGASRVEDRAELLKSLRENPRAIKGLLGNMSGLMEREQARLELQVSSDMQNELNYRKANTERREGEKYEDYLNRVRSKVGERYGMNADELMNFVDRAGDFERLKNAGVVDQSYWTGKVDIEDKEFLKNRASVGQLENLEDMDLTADARELVKYLRDWVAGSPRGQAELAARKGLMNAPDLGFTRDGKVLMDGEKLSSDEVKIMRDSQSQKLLKNTSYLKEMYEIMSTAQKQKDKSIHDRMQVLMPWVSGRGPTAGDSSGKSMSPVAPNSSNGGSGNANATLRKQMNNDQGSL